MDNTKKPSSLTGIFIATLVCLFGGFIVILLMYRNPGGGQGFSSVLPTPIPDSAASGNPAPQFTAQSVDGRTVNLSDYRGQVVIVNFWTTWCPSCVDEMPVLQDVHRRYADQGVVVLAVDIGESKSEVQRYLSANDLDLTVLLDSREQIAAAYSIRSIPTTYIIDPQGEIDDVHFGSLSAAQFEQYISAASGSR
ncbi:MAG: TlpA family protein disulfide reductase [Anaerolineae bacterium]|nr:TlpA family protein disulfide reductase [Anaerolineae bacterium]